MVDQADVIVRYIFYCFVTGVWCLLTLIGIACVILLAVRARSANSKLGSLEMVNMVSCRSVYLTTRWHTVTFGVSYPYLAIIYPAVSRPLALRGCLKVKNGQRCDVAHAQETSSGTDRVAS